MLSPINLKTTPQGLWLTPAQMNRWAQLHPHTPIETFSFLRPPLSQETPFRELTQPLKPKGSIKMKKNPPPSLCATSKRAAQTSWSHACHTKVAKLEKTQGLSPPSQCYLSGSPFAVPIQNSAQKYQSLVTNQEEHRNKTKTKHHGLSHFVDLKPQIPI